MRLIAGLGNPGDEYEDTPHNVGFRLLDTLIENLKISGINKKFNSLYFKKSINGEACYFIKPQTYMNRSGKAIASFANFFQIPIENIIIISDDIDLELGKARFRLGGGHGGHNGLRSVIDSLGDSNFFRLRVGVGRPQGNGDVVRHVLSPWPISHQKIAIKIFNIVTEELITFLENSNFENTTFTCD